MTSFNEYLFQLIFGLSHRNFLLDDLGIFLADYLPYLLILGFFFLIYSLEGWKKRLLVLSEGAVIVILSRGIITELIRFFYHSPRPFVVLGFSPLMSESGYSFPSGHASIFFALALTIFYLNRRLGWWYFGFALVNGLARIFVGVHWPIDIVGGAVVGILSAMIMHKQFGPIAVELEKTKVQNLSSRVSS